MVIDRQLALSAIGYEPRYTLEDGIREMVEFTLEDGIRLSDRNDKLDLWICSPASFRAGEHLF